MENNKTLEHSRVMEAMAQYLDDTKPQLGIFWFDPEKGELHEQQFRALLVLEFNLSGDFVFDVDIHWELGNGWDEFDV